MPSRRSPVPPRRLQVAFVAFVVLLGLLTLALTTSAHAATEFSATPGKVRFVKRMDPSFDSFVTNPTQQRVTWINDRFWRMEVFTPFFDSRVNWYPGGWVYKDSFAIYADDAGDVSRRGKWILKDTSGQPLYIDYDCGRKSSTGVALGCPQYAADITDPAFRADWIADLRATFAARNYRGVWVDDVNLAQTLARKFGETGVTAYSPTLKRAITDADWRRAMATFMEEIRAGIAPQKEILHNSPWGYGRDADGGWYPEADRQIRAADYINREGGFASDSGLSTPEQLRGMLGYADLVHRLGKGVVFDDFPANDTEREYSLAGYLLANTGADAVGDISQTPSAWWPGWDTDLGAAKGPRFRWNGLLRRDFDGGMVLLKEPGSAATGTVALGATLKNLAGQSVTSVNLAAGRGAVLKGTPPAYTAPPAPKITSFGPSSWYLDVWTWTEIKGTNLKDAEVTVGGRPVEPLTASDTSITLTIPGSSWAGPTEVKVTTPGGSATTTYTYMSRGGTAPKVTAISPVKGYADTATPVTVTGTALSGASVTVGGRPATVTASSATSLSFEIPRGDVGSAAVKVRTPAGVASTAFTRELRPGPVIEEVERVPVSGLVYAAIDGRGFTGATTVTFGSTPATKIYVLSDTRILALEPLLTEGTMADLRVTTPTATSPIGLEGRWAVLRTPKVTAISPASGPVAGGTKVTLTGTNLGNATVYVGGVVVPSSGTATSITFTTPAGAAGAKSVQVRSDGGSAGTTFTYS